MKLKYLFAAACALLILSACTDAADVSSKQDVSETISASSEQR